MARVYVSTRAGRRSRVTVAGGPLVWLMVLPFVLPILVLRALGEVVVVLARMSADIETRTRRGRALTPKELAQRRFLVFLSVMAAVMILTAIVVGLQRSR